MTESVISLRSQVRQGLMAAAAGAAQRRTGTTAAVTPPPVTRGESAGAVSAAKVDWLNVTFAGPDRYTQQQFVGLLARVFGRPITGDQGRGLFGFEHGIKLLAHVSSRRYPIGSLCWGGDAQRGRWMLQLTGSGCELVRSWSRMQKLIEALDARITRLDLAVDFLEGEYSVEDALAMYDAGEFTSRGRPPSTSVAGDWLEGEKGRTLYIGKATNGKLLRVYEKGKQLGNVESAWTRFEVQFGNRDRVIPTDALTNRDAFFAGAYPALERMVASSAEAIKTTQTSGATTLAHLVFHLKRSYGKLIDVIADGLGMDTTAMVEEIRVVGAPRRLHPSAVASGLTCAQLIARLRGNKVWNE